MRISLFIVPLLLFWIYAEIGLNYVPTSYGKLQRNFYLYRSDIEVLIVGKSDSQLGVAPKYFQKYKGYNLSNVSQWVYTSTELILNNIDKLDNLKLVVLSVDALSFYETTIDNPERWREKFYYHYWGLMPEFGEPDYLWSFKTGLFNFKTIITYALQGFYKIPAPYIDAIDSTGWERGYFENSHELLNDKAGKLIAQVHLGDSNQFSQYIVNKQTNIGYISKLNKALKKKGIKLIIIQLPKSKYFMKNIPKQLMVQNERLLDSIYRTMDIPYFNFTNDPAFTDQDFRDVNHLNYIGAKKFSETLSQIVEHNLN